MVLILGRRASSILYLKELREISRNVEKHVYYISEVYDFNTHAHLCSDLTDFSSKKSFDANTLLLLLLLISRVQNYVHVQVAENDQISLVKQLASEKLDVPVDQQRLVFKGKTLAGTVYLIVCLSSLLMVLSRSVGHVAGMTETLQLILITSLHDFHFNLIKKMKVDFSIISPSIRYNEIGLYTGLMLESTLYT